MSHYIYIIYIYIEREREDDDDDDDDDAGGGGDDDDDDDDDDADHDDDDHDVDDDGGGGGGGGDGDGDEQVSIAKWHRLKLQQQQPKGQLQNLLRMPRSRLQGWTTIPHVRPPSNTTPRQSHTGRLYLSPEDERTTCLNHRLKTAASLVIVIIECTTNAM